MNSHPTFTVVLENKASLMLSLFWTVPQYHDHSCSQTRHMLSVCCHTSSLHKQHRNMYSSYPKASLLDITVYPTTGSYPSEIFFFLKHTYKENFYLDIICYLLYFIYSKIFVTFWLFLNSSSTRMQNYFSNFLILLKVLPWKEVAKTF